MHAAMLFADFLQATLDCGGIRRIQTESFGVQFVGEDVEPTLITRNKAQLTTLRRQLSCQGRTNAAARSENEDAGALGVLAH